MPSPPREEENGDVAGLKGEPFISVSVGEEEGLTKDVVIVGRHLVYVVAEDVYLVYTMKKVHAIPFVATLSEHRSTCDLRRWPFVASDAQAGWVDPGNDSVCTFRELWLDVRGPR